MYFRDEVEAEVKPKPKLRENLSNMWSKDEDVIDKDDEGEENDQVLQWALPGGSINSKTCGIAGKSQVI